MIPAPVVSFMRGEFEAVAAGHHHREWLTPTLERLRARARGATADWPTMQETISSMVAPSAFQGAASSIRTRAWHYIWRMVLRALLLSAALAGGLRLLWRLPATAPGPAPLPVTKETPEPKDPKDATFRRDQRWLRPPIARIRFSVGAAVATISKPLTFLRAFAAQYAPWISLGVGLLSRVLNKHDIQFAPKAVALLVVAWTLPAVVARLMPDPRPGVTEPRWRRAIRTVGAPFAVVVLYKNILFFLVPIWFGAAQFPSLNMGVPLLLAAMALGTCFASQYQHRIIEHPVRRVLWSAVVLFAALVPALEVMAFASPRVSLFLAALLSAAVATAALRSDGASILSRRALGGILAGAIPVAALVVLAAPLLPARARRLPRQGRRHGDRESQPGRSRRGLPARHPSHLCLVRGVAPRPLPAAGDLQVVPRRGRSSASRSSPTSKAGAPAATAPPPPSCHRRLAIGAPTCSTKRASWSVGSRFDVLP